MAANLTYHMPLTQVKTISGNAPLTTGQYPEAASQTFANGAPVQLDGSGYVEVWQGTPVTNLILGIAPYYGNNLASAGLGAPVEPFGSVGQGASLTFGTVPNQPHAVNIPMGAPMVDGRHVLYIACPDTVFEGQIDRNGGTAAVTALTLVGQAFGLTADTSTPPQWYVDLDKTNNGTDTCVIIVGLDPLDPIGTAEGRVLFVFQNLATQFSAGT